MMERHKHPFAKYAGSIDSKLNIKLSEEEIKEQERGVSVHTSCHDIDIIRRAHTRLFRWIRKGKKKTKISQGINNKTTAALYSWRYDDNEVDKICTQL